DQGGLAGLPQAGQQGHVAGAEIPLPEPVSTVLGRGLQIGERLGDITLGPRFAAPRRRDRGGCRPPLFVGGLAGDGRGWRALLPGGRDFGTRNRLGTVGGRNAIVGRLHGTPRGREEGRPTEKSGGLRRKEWRNVGWVTGPPDRRLEAPGRFFI